MVDEQEQMSYRQLMEVIGWFFFDLFILGYVEDPDTGESFRLPGGLSMNIYIEVICAIQHECTYIYFLYLLMD